jgi:hypothetical protein
MSPDENITLVSGWIVRADAKPNCRGKRLSASGQLQTFGRRREVVRFASSVSYVEPMIPG